MSRGARIQSDVRQSCFKGRRVPRPALSGVALLRRPDLVPTGENGFSHLIRLAPRARWHGPCSVAGLGVLVCVRAGGGGGGGGGGFGDRGGGRGGAPPIERRHP